ADVNARCKHGLYARVDGPREGLERVVPSTFASLLIVGLGLDPVRVSKQLGHANPSITLKVYAHLFEQARHADELRSALGDGFGHLLDGNAVSTGGRNGAQPVSPRTAQLSRIGS